jgi:hypothetical protein
MGRGANHASAARWIFEKEKEFKLKKEGNILNINIT